MAERRLIVQGNLALQADSAWSESNRNKLHVFFDRSRRP
jgi:hypothetical protein